MGSYEIVLIIVSVLLLICIIFIAVLLMRRKNTPKNQQTNQERYIPPTNDSQINSYMQPFDVLNNPSGGSGGSGGGFSKSQEPSYQTSPIGFGDKQQTNATPFFSGTLSDEHEGTVLLDSEGGFVPEVSHEVRTGTTVQYYNNGVSQNFRLTGPYALIGREPSCDIIIDSDTYMSKQHAILFIRNGGLCLADLNSKNGTYVNERRIDGIVYISGNEKIKLASSEIKVLT